MAHTITESLEGSTRSCILAQFNWVPPMSTRGSGRGRVQNVSKTLVECGGLAKTPFDDEKVVNRWNSNP
jgi:hypothetical protein